MKRWLIAFFLGSVVLVLSGCGGGESSSSVLHTSGDQGSDPVDVPQPSNPSDPDEWESEENETRYTQITSAVGSTPPPPPVIVR